MQRTIILRALSLLADGGGTNIWRESAFVCRWKRAICLIVFITLASVSNSWAFGTLIVTPNPAAVDQEVTLTWPTVSGIGPSCIVYRNGAYLASVSCADGQYVTTHAAVGEYSYKIMEAGLYQETNAVVLVVEESNGSDPDPTPTLPNIVSFTASSTSITTAQSSILAWSVENAESCVAGGSWSGNKSAPTGSETLSGLSIGNHSYILTCQNAAGSSEPKTVAVNVVAENPSVQITSFTASAASIIQGEAASLAWNVSNAKNCTGTGSWSGSKNINGGTSSISSTIRNAPGDYSFTLTCTDATAGTDSKTVTFKVLPGTPEITKFDFNPNSANSRIDQGIVFVAAGSAGGINVDAKNAASCTLKAGDQVIRNTTAPYLASTNIYTFTGSGRQDITFSCEGYEDKGTVSQTAPVYVVPPPIITSFEAFPGSVISGQSATLSWTTQNASTCTLDDQATDGVNSQANVTPDFGTQQFIEYELSCAWGSDFETLMSPVKMKASVAKAVELSGRYFGAYNLLMANAPRAGETGIPLSAGYRPKEDGSGAYNVLGFSQPGTFWMWDFDELNTHETGKIYLGGSNLLALGSVTPPFRLYSPDRQRIDGQYFPDEHPPLADHIGTFTSRGDGTYDVWFNYQIFMGTPAQWPLVKLTNRMRVTPNEQGQLQIITLDYTENGPPLDSPDGIPGMRSPMSANPGAGILENEIDIYGNEIKDPTEHFPARVSPQFYSKSMLQIDPADLGANGLPKVVNDALGLDNALADNDGDGIPDMQEIGDNWALPLSTDSVLGTKFRDYVFDVLKPTQFINPPQYAGLIPLGSGERVVLYSEDENLMGLINRQELGYVGARHQEINPRLLGGGAEYWYPDAPQAQLPATHPSNGEALSYELGSLVFRPIRKGSGVTGNPPNLTYSLYFNKGVPDGLLLIDMSSNDAYTQTSLIQPVVLEDGHTAQFSMPYGGGTNSVPKLVLAHTGEPRTFADGNKFDPTEPGYQTLLTQAAAWAPSDLPDPDPVQIVSFGAAPSTVILGNSATLLWDAQNAGTCSLTQGSTIVHPALEAAGSYLVTPEVVGEYTYELVCSGAGAPASATTTVTVQSASTPIDPNALTGIWTGNFSLTMRVAGSASQADPQGTVLGDSHNNAWTFNFDEGWAELDQGMLSVGFPFHVQDLGNADPVHDRAFFTDNGDGTYTLHHGYQIYNPYVGNPRTDMTTTFRIVRDGNQLIVTTLDPDGDGVPGLPVPNVFPLTVSPGIDGVLTQDGSANPNPTDPTDPGNT
ncbi:MAG: PKD domain-containing protein, partial [Pusillimonas sp.]